MRSKDKQEQVEKFMDTLLYSHWDLGLLAEKLIKLKDDEE